MLRFGWALALAGGVVMGGLVVGCGASAADGDGLPAPDAPTTDPGTDPGTQPPTPDPGPVGACDAGALRCNGAFLELCVDDLGWVIREVCGSPALCNGEFGYCSAAACAAGEQLCDGATLQRCNAEQTGFDSLELCASAAQCDPALGCQP